MKTASVQEAVERALKKVSYEALTGCWLWDGSMANGRFGSLKYAGKTWKASRFLFTHLKEEIRDGMYLLHSCDNEACVNPGHLRQGTQFENMHDMISRGRQFKGQRIGKPKKLTEPQVREIRAAEGSHAAIAKRYGVCPQTVSDIKHRKLWKHVKD